MTGIGDTLRSARLARSEDLATCSAATGIGPRLLEALERDDLDALPPTAHGSALVERYARHLGLDLDGLTDPARPAFDDDSDADTQRIPVITPPRRARDATLLWVGAGAVLGLGILAVAGGGLGGGDAPQAPTRADRTSPSATARTTSTGANAQANSQTTTQANTQTGSGSPSTLQPAEPAGDAIVLRLDARAGRTVWVEVRAGDVGGEQLFAGIVGGGVTRTVRSDTPLWLGVAWAPNVALTLNGEPLDAEGGTESYRVTARGVTLL